MSVIFIIFVPLRLCQSFCFLLKNIRILKEFLKNFMDDKWIHLEIEIGKNFRFVGSFFLIGRRTKLLSYGFMVNEVNEMLVSRNFDFFSNWIEFKPFFNIYIIYIKYRFKYSSGLVFFLFFLFYFLLQKRG